MYKMLENNVSLAELVLDIILHKNLIILKTRHNYTKILDYNLSIISDFFLNPINAKTNLVKPRVSDLSKFENVAVKNAIKGLQKKTCNIFVHSV